MAEPNGHVIGFSTPFRLIVLAQKTWVTHPKIVIYYAKVSQFPRSALKTESTGKSVSEQSPRSYTIIPKTLNSNNRLALKWLNSSSGGAIKVQILPYLDCHAARVPPRKLIYKLRSEFRRTFPVYCRLIYSCGLTPPARLVGISFASTDNVPHLQILWGCCTYLLQWGTPTHPLYSWRTKNRKIFVQNAKVLWSSRPFAADNLFSFSLFRNSSLAHKAKAFNIANWFA